MEVALLKAIEARGAVSIDALLRQLQNLRDSSGMPAAPAGAAPAGMSAPERANAPALPKSAAGGAGHAAAAAAGRGPSQAAASAALSGDLGDLWGKLVEAVGRVSQFTRSYLLEAHPVSLEKNVLTIGFDPEFADHLGLVDTPRNHALLQTKLSELGHPNAQIKLIKAEAPANPSPPPVPAETPPAPAAGPASTRAAAAKTAAPGKGKLASVPFSKDDFENDPLIQKALEIFKGQIVEVRA